MFERGISITTVESVVKQGEIIKSYPDDRPYPSYLLLSFENNQPIHVVVAKRENSNTCLIVTAYIPHNYLWYGDFKNRKS